jgi:uncharacterized membrane protein YhfC
MDILRLAYTINPIMIFILAIGLGIYLTRKYNVGWRLYFIGGATYLCVQLASVVLLGLINSSNISTDIPLILQLLLTLLIVILLFVVEEGIRYAIYRWWAKGSRTWSEGMVLGSGHGGTEIIIIGLVTLYTLSQYIQLRNADLTKIFNAENIAQATKNVTSYWSESWYNVFPEAVRCLLTLPIQLSCSLLVLQVFLRQQYRWLGYAIGWHALASTPLFISGYFFDAEKYIYLPLLFYAVVSVVSVVIILRMKKQAEANNWLTS